MKKKVLLANVSDYWLRTGGDRPSLGNLYIASYLRNKNLADVQVMDLNHCSDDKLMDFLHYTRPDIVGISMTTPQYKEGLRIAKLVREVSPAVVVGGGSHVTAINGYEKLPNLLPEVFDYCVVGSGETGLEQIIKGADNRIILGDKPFNDRVIDSLPFPARDLLNMKNYSLSIDGVPATPVMTSFGCPWRCVFCSEPVLNNRYQCLSPERVVAEIEHLNTRYGFNAFVFYDDVFSIDTKRAIEINKLLKTSLPIKYRATTRATDFVRNPELADYLKLGGCVEVCLGLESGDDEILKKSDKGMSVKTNIEALNRCHNAGLKVLTYMITGLPGCSPESEQRSLDFVRTHKPDHVGWYMLAPFPSTPLWRERKKYGVTIFDDEIIANDFDIMQCSKNNKDVTCYVDYSISGGLSRFQIKDLWLKMMGEL